MAKTIWSRQDCFVRAFWGRPGESPGWAADRVMALLGFVQARDPSLGSSLLHIPWDGSRAELQRLFEELPVVDDHGKPTTAWGYADPGLLITGYEEPVRVSLSIGSPSVEDRIPSHKVSASVERLSPEHTKALSESLFEGFVLAFDPLYVEMVTLDELLMWHRLEWQIRPGYRIWLNDVVGEISWLADGMTSQRMGSGTVYSCPDDWTSQQVVDAWKAVLERSGLDEIPRDLIQNMDVPDYLPVPDQVRIIAPKWADEKESDEVTETPHHAQPPEPTPPAEPASFEDSASGQGESGMGQFVYRQQITGLRPGDPRHHHPARNSNMNLSGTPAWTLGLIALFPLPILNSALAGVVMLVVGLNQRNVGGTAAQNGVNAASWGLLQIVVPALFFITMTVGMITGEDTETGLRMPAPLEMALPIFGITWIFLSIAHLVVVILGIVKSSRGEVFRAPVPRIFKTSGQ